MHTSLVWDTSIFALQNTSFGCFCTSLEREYCYHKGHTINGVRLCAKTPWLSNIFQAYTTKSPIALALPANQRCMIPKHMWAFSNRMKIAKLLVALLWQHTVVNRVLVSLNLIPQVLRSFIDFGATNNIFGNRSFFPSLITTDNWSSIAVINGSQTQACGIGTNPLPSLNVTMLPNCHPADQIP